MADGPMWSRGALDVVNNTYVVRNGLLYEYYPIACKPRKPEDKFIKLEISPGIIAPGIAIVGKQLYDVSVDDLFRRRINVSKRHTTIDANVGRTVRTKKTKSIAEPKTSADEQGSSTNIRNEISEVTDMAWQNQVDSLLQVISAKEGEEFEITGTSQSGRLDASHSISDIFEDIELD